MKIFDAQYLAKLSSQAKNNPRLRQHSNIHHTNQDNCQRLFNAIELGSYIRPHRHLTDPKEELLIAIRGKMALVTFDEQGNVIDILSFGTERGGVSLPIGAEVSNGTWHTVVALETGCILLEVKAGPFDPDQPKDLAPWAPEEFSGAAADYLNQLIEISRA